MEYRGYKLSRRKYQGTTCYVITTPEGEFWRELSANVATARKWVDAYIIEQRAKIGGR